MSETTIAAETTTVSTSTTTITEVRSGILSEQGPPCPILYRIDDPNGRWYYRFVRQTNEDGSFMMRPAFYPSVTSFLKNAHPMGDGLMRWAINTFQNTHDYRTFMDYAAHYGTFTHLLFADVLYGRTIDLDTMSARVRDYVRKHHLDEQRTASWAQDARTDLYAIERWRRDYKVVPIAIELPLASDETGTAGTLDLACLITHDGKLNPVSSTTRPEHVVEEAVIVDYKSGCRSGDFYEDYKYQLGEYQLLWNHNFGTTEGLPPVRRTFNLSPKDWNQRSRTYYNFTEQTLSANETVALHAMRSQFRVRLQERLKAKSMEGLRPNITLPEFQGKLNADADLKELYQFVNLDDLLARCHPEHYDTGGIPPHESVGKAMPNVRIGTTTHTADVIETVDSPVTDTDAITLFVDNAPHEQADTSDLTPAVPAPTVPESLLDLAMYLS